MRCSFQEPTPGDIIVRHTGNTLGGVTDQRALDWYKETAHLAVGHTHGIADQGTNLQLVLFQSRIHQQMDRVDYGFAREKVVDQH